MRHSKQLLSGCTSPLNYPPLWHPLVFHSPQQWPSYQAPSRRTLQPCQPPFRCCEQALIILKSLWPWKYCSTKWNHSVWLLSGNSAYRCDTVSSFVKKDGACVACGVISAVLRKKEDLWPHVARSVAHPCTVLTMYCLQSSQYARAHCEREVEGPS